MDSTPKTHVDAYACAEILKVNATSVRKAVNEGGAKNYYVMPVGAKRVRYLVDPEEIKHVILTRTDLFPDLCTRVANGKEAIRRSRPGKNNPAPAPAASVNPLTVMKQNFAEEPDDVEELLDHDAPATSANGKALSLTLTVSAQKNVDIVCAYLRKHEGATYQPHQIVARLLHMAARQTEEGTLL